MRCMDCGKSEAVVFLKMAVNNKVAEAHLCAVCAAKKGAGPDACESGSLNISEIGGGLEGGFSEFLPAGKKALHCPACALTYREFREKGKLGCPVCYTSFDAQLSELLTRVHGSCLHTGKVYPARAAMRQGKCDSAAKRKRGAQTALRLKKLDSSLKEAVDREDFETAARLRDQIKGLEQ
ncbi:MAG TPA: excinuclease ABC subunit B [Elusimicrobia bacterium]|nr:excinuclease ABC subunit B [Elusimicrobiota bacterium]